MYRKQQTLSALITSPNDVTTNTRFFFIEIMAINLIFMFGVIIHKTTI